MAHVAFMRASGSCAYVPLLIPSCLVFRYRACLPLRSPSTALCGLLLFGPRAHIQGHRRVISAWLVVVAWRPSSPYSRAHCKHIMCVFSRSAGLGECCRRRCCGRCGITPRIPCEVDQWLVQGLLLLFITAVLSLAGRIDRGPHH